MKYTKKELQAMADDVAGEIGVDPALLKAVIETESNWNPNAKSQADSKGRRAEGLGQLRGPAQKDFGVTDPYDPLQNITATAKFLKQNVDMFDGDVEKAALAYHAGPGNVKKYGTDVDAMHKDGKTSVSKNYIKQFNKRYESNGGSKQEIDVNNELQVAGSGNQEQSSLESMLNEKRQRNLERQQRFDELSNPQISSVPPELQNQAFEQQQNTGNYNQNVSEQIQQPQVQPQQVQPQPQDQQQNAFDRFTSMTDFPKVSNEEMAQLNAQNAEKAQQAQPQMKPNEVMGGTNIDLGIEKSQINNYTVSDLEDRVVRKIMSLEDPAQYFSLLDPAGYEKVKKMFNNFASRYPEQVKELQDKTNFFDFGMMETAGNIPMSIAGNALALAGFDELNKYNLNRVKGNERTANVLTDIGGKQDERMLGNVTTGAAALAATPFAAPVGGSGVGSLMANSAINSAAIGALTNKNEAKDTKEFYQNVAKNAAIDGTIGAVTAGATKKIIDGGSSLAKAGLNKVEAVRNKVGKPSKESKEITKEAQRLKDDYDIDKGASLYMNKFDDTKTKSVDKIIEKNKDVHDTLISNKDKINKSVEKKSKEFQDRFDVNRYLSKNKTIDDVKKIDREAMLEGNDTYFQDKLKHAVKEVESAATSSDPEKLIHSVSRLNFLNKEIESKRLYILADKAKHNAEKFDLTNFSRRLTDLQRGISDGKTKNAVKSRVFAMVEKMTPDKKGTAQQLKTDLTIPEMINRRNAIDGLISTETSKSINKDTKAIAELTALKKSLELDMERAYSSGRADPDAIKKWKDAQRYYAQNIADANKDGTFLNKLYKSETSDKYFKTMFDKKNHESFKKAFHSFDDNEKNIIRAGVFNELTAMNKDRELIAGTFKRNIESFNKKTSGKSGENSLLNTIFEKQDIENMKHMADLSERVIKFSRMASDKNIVFRTGSEASKILNSVKEHSSTVGFVSAALLGSKFISPTASYLIAGAAIGRAAQKKLAEEALTKFILSKGAKRELLKMKSNDNIDEVLESIGGFVSKEIEGMLRSDKSKNKSDEQVYRKVIGG